MTIGNRLRFVVLRRDNFTCQYCGKKPPEVSLEIDHVVARANGGSDDESNLITACFGCNRGKRTDSVIPITETCKDNSTTVWICHLCGKRKIGSFPDNWAGWDTDDICNECLDTIYSEEESIW